jgi:hypothetical protein
MPRRSRAVAPDVSGISPGSGARPACKRAISLRALYDPIVRWPELRAGLISFAIVLGVVDGCPIPPPSETPAWERGLVDAIRPFQRWFLWPFTRFHREVRFSQRWALFQDPSRTRYRFEVNGRSSSGPWHPLFRAGDPEHTEYASLLLYRRIHGAWNPTDRPTMQYPGFAEWFLGRVLADHPELTLVGLRQQKVLIDDDGQVHDTGQYDFGMVRGRGSK